MEYLRDETKVKALAVYNKTMAQTEKALTVLETFKKNKLNIKIK